MRKKRRIFVVMIIISACTIITVSAKLHAPEPRRVFDAPPVVPTSFPDPTDEEQNGAADTPENESDKERPETANDPDSESPSHQEPDPIGLSPDSAAVELG